ncbi:protein of unknown function [Pseudomonas sp. JV241A]|nr:protein of unknown function [Pseudomonas sp. JV241A]
MVSDMRQASFFAYLATTIANVQELAEKTENAMTNLPGDLPDNPQRRRKPTHAWYI